MNQSMHFLGAAWQSRRSQVWKTLRWCLQDGKRGMCVSVIGQRFVLSRI
jgi:hypothetical protein